ncbi:MAG TPA: hypothetical protein VGJ73_02285 [Verrucomicrobiae bacterium]|jgi:predicted aspartyl protease
MSIFKIRIVARNPGNETLVTPALDALVDTRSELTWLPREALKRIEVVPRRKRLVSNAGKSQVERAVGHVILHSNGRETKDEVVFAEFGDSMILGLRALEGLGLSPDDTEHRFISMIKFVAFQLHEPKPASQPFSITVQTAPRKPRKDSSRYKIAASR